MATNIVPVPVEAILLLLTPTKVPARRILPPIKALYGEPRIVLVPKETEVSIDAPALIALKFPADVQVKEDSIEAPDNIAWKWLVPASAWIEVKTQAPAPMELK